MKILVTGGCGFIGSNFIWYFLKKHPEYKIVNLDKLTYAANLKNLKGIEESFKGRYEFVKGDICNEALIDSLVKKCDAIVHFAAESSVDASIKSPDVFLNTNILGTHVLLKAALKYKKRFHHISTDEVFGELSLDDERKFNENSPYNPKSPYSASKASSDHLVMSYFYTYGLFVTISNCSNNYGPFQFPEKIIPLFILNALQNKELPIYGDGKSVRDYLFVEDHCEAIDLILHKGKPGNKYCIGGGEEKNGIEIADVILSKLDKPKKLKKFVKDRPGHDRRYAVDYSKIKNELGWKPKIAFDDGIRLTIDWYKNHKDWW